MNLQVNYFVANTPFQLLALSNIITTYYNTSQYKNYIVSTVKADIKVQNANIYLIRRGIFAVYDIFLLKKKLISSLHESTFFIPHLNNLFSSYFYYLSQKNNRQIHVYYEGIALFYKPHIKLSSKIHLKRYILAKLSGIYYTKHTEFYTDALLKNAYCFTPVPKLCNHFSNPKLFKFKKFPLSASHHILILINFAICEEDINFLIKELKLNKKKGGIIYLKPHYSLDKKNLILISNVLKKEFGVESCILDKYKPIEEYYDKISFDTVISQTYSSALINMKLIFGEEINIFVMKQSINSEIEHIFSHFNLVNK